MLLDKVSQTVNGKVYRLLLRPAADWIDVVGYAQSSTQDRPPDGGCKIGSISGEPGGIALFAPRLKGQDKGSKPWQVWRVWLGARLSTHNRVGWHEPRIQCEPDAKIRLSRHVQIKGAWQMGVPPLAECLLSRASGF